MKSKKYHLAVTAAVVCLTVGTIGYDVIRPSAQANAQEPAPATSASYPADAAAKLAALEAKYPAIVSLKTHEPQTYEELKQVVASAVQAKKSDAEITDDVTSVFKGYEQTKTAYLSDELLVKGLNADLDIARNLKVTSPQKCTQMLTNQPFGSLAGLIKPEVLDREWAIYNEVVLAPKATGLPAGTHDDAKNAIHSIIDKETAAQNIKAEEVGNILGGKDEPVKSCNFLIAFMADIAALPPTTIRAITNAGNK